MNENKNNTQENKNSNYEEVMKDIEKNNTKPIENEISKDNDLQKHPSKNQSLKNIVFLISSLLFICSGVCLMTGCFAPDDKITQSFHQEKKIVFKYANFVEAWNRNLNDSYFLTFKTENLILPHTNQKEVINKLNTIFNPDRIQKEIKKYQQKLTNNQLLDLPIKEYISFLKTFNFKKNAFNENLSDKDIEKLILFMMHSDYNYLTLKTMKKLAWTYSFENYFKDNINIFLKKGFSRNIKNYKKYISIINQN